MPSRLGSILRTLPSVGPRTFWVLADQAVVSIGNFTTGLVLVRSLPEQQFGAYAVLLETMLFLNSLQNALVIYPLTVHGATGNDSWLRRYASTALLFTIALLPILGLAMGCAAWLGVDANGSGLALAVAVGAVTAMLLWQIQETMRRALLARFRASDCIIGDAMSYLGQASVMYLLHQAHLLTLPVAFAVIGVTSAVAATVQALQVGLVRVAWADVRHVASEFWHLGRWSMLTSLTTAITNLSFFWVLRSVHGLNASAVFAAVIVPSKLANPVLLGLGNLMIPAVAKASREHGRAASIRPASLFGLTGAAILLPYYAFLIALPWLALRILLPADSPYLDQAPLVRLFAFSMVAIFIESVLTGWLSGLGESRANFFAQTIHACLAVAVGIPVTIRFGVEGAILSSLATNSISAIAEGFFLRKVLRGEPVSLFTRVNTAASNPDTGPNVAMPRVA